MITAWIVAAIAGIIGLLVLPWQETGNMRSVGAVITVIPTPDSVPPTIQNLAHPEPPSMPHFVVLDDDGNRHTLFSGWPKTHVEVGARCALVFRERRHVLFPCGYTGRRLLKRSLPLHNACGLLQGLMIEFVGPLFY